MSSETINILLVEDETQYAKLAMKLLVEAKKVKFVPVHVKLIGEAIQRLSEDSFDAIMLDLGLPDSKGDLDAFSR